MSANTAVPQTTPTQMQVEEAVMAGHKRKPEQVTNEKNQKVGTCYCSYKSIYNAMQQQLFFKRVSRIL